MSDIDGLMRLLTWLAMVAAWVVLVIVVLIIICVILDYVTSYYSCKNKATVKMTLRQFKDMYSINSYKWQTFRGNEEKDANNPKSTIRTLSYTHDDKRIYVCVPWYSYLGLHRVFINEHKDNQRIKSDFDMCVIIKGVQADIDREKAKIDKEREESRAASQAFRDRLKESTKLEPVSLSNFRDLVER